jgi:hypothetical protein
MKARLALAAVLRRHPLLAFDFDGTLAPIVARPDDARLSQAVSARLKALALQSAAGHRHRPHAWTTCAAGWASNPITSWATMAPRIALDPAATAAFAAALNGLRASG